MQDGLPAEELREVVGTEATLKVSSHRFTVAAYSVGMTNRNYAVTGSASGIGAQIRDVLESLGHRVIGIDLQAAEVQADLSTPEGRSSLAPQVSEQLAGQPLHGIVAAAGLGAPKPLTLAVNYFGAVATLQQLRPLLAPQEGRAVAIASASAVLPISQDLLQLCLSGDEATALAYAAEIAQQPGNLIYSTSKRALAQYVRRHAPSAEWAGQGLPLNAVAPGVTETAMVAQYRNDPAAYARLQNSAPMPLGGMSQPIDIAWPVVWLLSAENRKITGQVLYVDAGSEVVIRGEDVWTGVEKKG